MIDLEAVVRDACEPFKVWQHPDELCGKAIMRAVAIAVLQGEIAEHTCQVDRIKHTSHRDGLGMGHQEREKWHVEQAERIESQIKALEGK